MLIYFYIIFTEWQNTVGDNVTCGYVQIEDYRDMTAENERLKKEIATLKSSALTRDLLIRQEMADTYTAMMEEIEANWRYVLILLICSHNIRVTQNYVIKNLNII